MILIQVNLGDKMKLKFLIYAIMLLTSVFVISCSDLTDEIVVNNAPTVHPSDWATDGSANFHALAFNDTNTTLAFCQSCHAKDYSGGLAKVSCSTCHQNELPHPTGWATDGLANFHANSFKNNNWNLNLCQSCHGANYSGEITNITDVSCRTCHKSDAGPEACNTCHGDFNDGVLTDSTRLAPPRAVFSEDSSAAGAHVSHLYANDLTDNVDCAQCHVVPNKMSDAGHIISGAEHATLTFGDLAKTQNANPNYDSNTKTCSNVYCHGNFIFLKDSSAFSFIYTADSIKGNIFSPIWDKLDDTQAECGTCHSLPPIGHTNAGNDPTASTCSTCHTGIVDANGNIIDKTKHINGKINVFGN